MAQARLDRIENQQKRMVKVIAHLKEFYPEAKCSLDYQSPFQLLVATILSAQCTDARVNIVTPALFKKFPNAFKMAKADVNELEKLIQSTGFYRAKAKSIHQMSQALVQEYGGEVPQEMEKLTQLRGVGRKTANVVLGVAFGASSLVVDTHVKRIAYRLGFTQQTDPVKIERELMDITPKKDWTDLAHLFISHGRKICTARKAHCEECPVNELCPKVGIKR
jgi:endonuclease III